MIERLLSLASAGTPYAPLIGMAGGLVKNLFSENPEQKMLEELRKKQAEAEGAKNTANATLKPLLRFGGVVNIDGAVHEKGGVDTGSVIAEGGETITKDGNFIFSDKLKKDGKTYADLSKLITNKYRGSKDILDNQNLQRELEELAVSQEAAKLKQIRYNMGAQGVDENGDITDSEQFNQYANSVKPIFELGGLTPFAKLKFDKQYAPSISEKVNETVSNKDNVFAVGDTLSFISQLAAPATAAFNSIYGLTQPKIDFDTINPHTITPEQISASTQLEAVNNASATAMDRLAASSNGQGNYMSNIAQLMMDSARTSAGIIQNVDNQNVQIRNNAMQYNASERSQADRINLQTQMEEEQRNQMTTDNLKTQFVNSLTAAGDVTAGFNKDKKLEYFDRLDQAAKIKMIKDIAPDWTFTGETPEELKSIFRKKSGLPANQNKLVIYVSR